MIGSRAWIAQLCRSLTVSIAGDLTISTVHIVAGRSLAEIRDQVTLAAFSDYAGYDRWLDQNIVTMWGYLYRYREPNQHITEDEAFLCREDVTQCRTADP